MAIPDHLVRRFGGLAKVPDYIKKFYKDRADRARQRKEAEAERKRKREQEYARIRSLRRPPANVRRIGQTLIWSPPETANQVKPIGYWVSEERHGQWTNHGDYVPADVFESQLFGTGDARVSTVYAQMALSEGYPGPVMPHVRGEHRYLMGAVRQYVKETRHGQAHIDRWRRVLAALGVTNGNWYCLRRGVRRNQPLPLHPAMTAEEAERNARRFNGGGWRPVVEVLRRLEGLVDVEVKFTEPEEPAAEEVKPEEPLVSPELVATLRKYLQEPTSRRPPIYYERWTRALAGMGVETHENPMSADEAQGYANRGWKRWVPVAEAIRRVENSREQS